MEAAAYKLVVWDEARGTVSGQIELLNLYHHGCKSACLCGFGVPPGPDPASAWYRRIQCEIRVIFTTGNDQRTRDRDL